MKTVTVICSLVLVTSLKIDQGEVLKALKSDNCTSNDLIPCLKGFTQAYNLYSEEISATRKEWDKLAKRSSNYLCEDPESTAPLHSGLTKLEGGDEYVVHTLLNTTDANIWRVPDFITHTECEALKDRAKKLGLHHVGEYTGATGNRIAKGISVVFSDSSKLTTPTRDYFVQSGEPIDLLYKRLFSLASRQTGIPLSIDGQEGMSILHYGPTDHYKRHCDGHCGDTRSTYWSKEHPGARVATAIVYCDEPLRGGATTFDQAGVVVRPSYGQLLLFSYMNRKLGSGLSAPSQLRSSYDYLGLTKHAGCPVHEGEKWIATAWMRTGLSTEKPWDKYDAFGNEI
jgi:prolyl 4-hydroxylase